MLTVSSRKTLVIDPLIISPSSYVAQHNLPAQLTIRCPVVVHCVIYHLSAASIALSCCWSLTHPGRKWITEGERVRESGTGVNVEINLDQCTQQYVVASGSAFINSIKGKRHRLCVSRWGLLSHYLHLSHTLITSLWYSTFIPSVYLKDLFPSPPFAPSPSPLCPFLMIYTESWIVDLYSVGLQARLITPRPLINSVQHLYRFWAPPAPSISLSSHTTPKSKKLH